MREASELIYDIPSVLLAAALLGLILLSVQCGAALGRRLRAGENEASKNQANAVQGSLLGLLALLLGFTFALSLDRFDQRSAAVVEEANAIGTAWLRTDLLSDARRETAKTLLRQYVGIRAESAALSAADVAERGRLGAEAEAVFARLWRVAVEEARATASPVAMGFAASLNDMIDALAARDAAISRHVPELVLLLLFGTFILLGGIVGYSSAISAIRPGFPVYVLVLLIVVLVFLIIDLDRPRRGLIEVDQTNLNAVIRSISR